MYAGGDYDLAGFAVGAVERDRILTGQDIQEGDAVLGLASSGLHSNGIRWSDRLSTVPGSATPTPAPFADGALADALLAPTRIYVSSCLRRTAPASSPASPISPAAGSSRTWRAFCPPG